MAAADTKPKAGDLVLLRQSQSGSKPGLHWVIAVVDDGGLVVEQLMSSWPQRFTAPFEDVVRRYPGLGDAEVTLAPRPVPKAEPAAATVAAPPRLVTIHVIEKPDGFAITRTRANLLTRGEVIHYKPIGVALKDEAAQRHFEFEVDGVDVGKALTQLGAHTAESCGKVAVFPSSRDPQFSEDA